MQKKRYSTDLTDSQWESTQKIIAAKRKRKYSLREVTNALLYIVKTGIQWRMLPKEFANWQLVYDYFPKWEAIGLIEQIHDVLRDRVRQNKGREKSPSLALLDSQSVKTSCMTVHKGFDSFKHINGRKRHIIVDTLGLILVMVIHKADVQDRTGAKELILELTGKYPRLQKILADGGYTRELIGWVAASFKWVLEIVHKVAGVSGFHVLPKR